MNRKTRLFTSLMLAYILFGLTIGVMEGILVYFIDDWLVLERASQLTASELVQPDYKKIPVDRIKAVGGRIEVLDQERRVIYTKGNPGWQEVYTAEELLSLLEDKKDQRYSYTLAPFQSESGERYTLLVTMPKEGKYALLQCNITLLLLFSLSVYFYSRWTAKRITGPLAKIITAIQRMREGHYGERLSYKSTFELTQIQEHFNEMAEELERINREKKELELSKQQMLLDLSHDLRTPITTIQGFTRAMQLGIVDDLEKQQRYLDTIYQKSSDLNALIENLLQLTALESPEYPLSLDTTDLAELLRQIAIEYYELFNLNGFTLSVDIPDKKVNIRMDRMLMHRAVSNLLSNALKHNKPGTEVSLLLEETNEFFLVKVCDNGQGIPKELRETLFQPFVKGDLSRKSGGGTGLGLSITHKAAELHGGMLRLGDTKEKTVLEIFLPKTDLE